ncbi:hypothetical protein B296_00031628 [Ensete ventricosum]|uniref:Uncharacterized protein n=1 Tax=Ensete ventricosum TaxID=4639 RepID=A0A427AFQ2_ENSVE|nr:hypothetical protein B296_00031628 [Ensete ventricosum]
MRPKDGGNLRPVISNTCQKCGATLRTERWEKGAASRAGGVHLRDRGGAGVGSAPRARWRLVAPFLGLQHVAGHGAPIPPHEIVSATDDVTKCTVLSSRSHVTSPTSGASSRSAFRNHSRHHGKELSALADGKRDGRLISVPFPPVTNGRFHGLCVRQLDPLPDKEHPYGPHVTLALPHHPHVPTGVWAPRIVHHFATPPQRHYKHSSRTHVAYASDDLFGDLRKRAHPLVANGNAGWLAGDRYGVPKVVATLVPPARPFFNLLPNGTHYATGRELAT